MAFKIAVAGKGGTGKTTFSALVIKQLLMSGKRPILAVDADANANLNEALGLKVEQAISDVINRLAKNMDPIPAGMTKDQYISFKIHETLSEGDDVDLLVMGGPEGQGCYCYANNLLRQFILTLSNNYPYIVMDNEAGMEHLSRRTTDEVDVFFVISDGSVRGIRSAGRIKQLIDSLDLKIKEKYLVITRIEEKDIPEVQEEIEKTGLKLIGVIPNDELVTEFDRYSKPLINLPEDSKAVAAVKKILKNAGII
ncbi:carbon monoxide dehydrogenase [Carboxydothermus islandicus]|uniref:Carbon monoxide dehydrogenase n=1 Tax=Carboxydothermus islandicus TaxID=661089 RepID=A0A1L8D0L1_9THEO|nr:AAA family ATPase [Carboxydothermus islandicus]GAV24698.1 carbon monoxide dehydrogenase [Carboxydothermus islandicus]